MTTSDPASALRPEEDGAPPRGATPPRIMAVGLATWDRLLVLDTPSQMGWQSLVVEYLEAPGGTTANAAVALARLGAQVALVSAVGDDEPGVRVRSALEREGIDTSALTTFPGRQTNLATIVVSGLPPERSILWRPGASLVRGDRLAITAIFAADIVLLDVNDMPLRRFLVDLPAHTLPNANLLGPLTYLALSGVDDALEIALRHDTIVGNEREVLAITGCPDLEAAIALIQRRMPGANLRSAAVSLGARGSLAFTRDERWNDAGFTVDVVDPTGAGDAFAGAVAFGLALRWPWPRILRFANAAGALSTRALGAQSALPSRDEVEHLLSANPPISGE